MPLCLPAGAWFRQDVLSLLDKLIPELLLGTWQGITLVELDGPRKREIIVDVR